MSYAATLASHSRPAEGLGDLLQQIREDRIASTGRADRVVQMCSSWTGTEDASLATVLFADDDPDIRELGRLLLVKHGHEVVTAADGRAAIELLLSFSPALVITDVNMPEEDGLAVCAAVRSSPGLREIPLVLLTALPANDERVVRASTATNAVILIKTDISRLGELADQLVGSCGDEAA